MIRIWPTWRSTSWSHDVIKYLRKVCKPMHASRSGSLHLYKDNDHDIICTDTSKCWSSIHNVNDRGYHKMWSPASSTRTMTNTSYYIQYSIETATTTSYHKMWSAMKEILSMITRCEQVIILQIDGHRLITVHLISQIPINWMSCPSNMILTTTSMIYRKEWCAEVADYKMWSLHGSLLKLETMM